MYDKGYGFEFDIFVIPAHPKRNKRELLSNWADVQAYPSLCLSQRRYRRVCRALAYTYICLDALTKCLATLVILTTILNY